MRRIIQKSLVTGLCSMLASLALSFCIVPLLGGQVIGAGLFMTIFCPLAISIPASAFHFVQSDRIQRAEAKTREVLQELEDAYEALRLQSRTDGLTGVLTRSAFLEDLEVLSQQGVSGGLLFLDLDYFKEINDRYGHAFGDEALRMTGRVLSSYQKQSDLVGRLGGEEFGVFQIGLNLEEMHKSCEEVRAEIAAIVLSADFGVSAPISASIGACHCSPGFDASERLRAADRNLYQAKTLGRNRVVA
ncbi:GGDEF domain-containing protein [Oryzifoliimicrobium ureilyticus]|uniref:GGDEF domain-containing protein n=1 Tax=Oryzifoliimicrobium ureilyticus TaxID=3113724 RepID=UPI0030767BF6